MESYEISMQIMHLWSKSQNWYAAASVQNAYQRQTFQVQVLWPTI